MGKRRRYNRNRPETSNHWEDPPKIVPSKQGPSTFKSILEKSRNNSPNSNQSNTDNGVGQPSLVRRYKPTPEEIRVLIPHVESRWELRRSDRRKDPYHYALWRDAYGSYLRILFGGFQNILNKFKVLLEEEISFETFSFFIYEISSGYISPYS